jgi:hypothetical protein
MWHLHCHDYAWARRSCDHHQERLAAGGKTEDKTERQKRRKEKRQDSIKRADGERMINLRGRRKAALCLFRSLGNGINL